jgi:hypothetical protein
VWKTIIEKARESRGSVFVPLKSDKEGKYTKLEDFAGKDELLYQSCGANLLDKTPEICNW